MYVVFIMENTVMMLVGGCFGIFCYLGRIDFNISFVNLQKSSII